MGRALVGRGFIAVSEDGAMKLAQIRGLKNLKIDDIYNEETVREAGIHSIYTIGDAAHSTGLLESANRQPERLRRRRKNRSKRFWESPRAVWRMRKRTAKLANLIFS
jgi:hypothetical protein